MEHSTDKQARWRGDDSAWLQVMKLRALAAVVCSFAAFQPAWVQAQSEPVINAGPTILVEPGAETPLPILVGPQDTIPKNSFLRLRGLPLDASLTEGHAIAPGSWAIPVAALTTLKISLPIGLSGKADVTISLVSVEGTVLAETRSSLLIAAAALIVPGKVPTDPRATNVAALGPAAPTTAPPPPSLAARPQRPSAPSPAEPQLIPKERERIIALLGRGNDQLRHGNVAAARLYYQRAAEAGLAQAALVLASTYDPDELVRLRVVGIQPDPELARRWYERARELGAPEAERRLKRLSAK
jgi:hypothetical protein